MEIRRNAERIMDNPSTESEIEIGFVLVVLCIGLCVLTGCCKELIKKSEDVAKTGCGVRAESFAAFWAFDRSGEDGGVVFNV